MTPTMITINQIYKRPTSIQYQSDNYTMRRSPFTKETKIDRSHSIYRTDSYYLIKKSDMNAKDNKSPHTSTGIDLTENEKYPITNLYQDEKKRKHRKLVYYNPDIFQ